ncbi:ExbD/TolR family protein [Dyadobacter bucti]|uniref:ExbD/TolR family protein n=1 Tax=Dyadobacter bucti TaxID=2572203 RepID=UPI001108151A|nr:biopolymer transporter ExbD [Dyadobacter bucti]
METIQFSGNGRISGLGKVRNSRLLTAVDMTPMVDLGFLLITFFMLTTTLSSPTAMSVFFPKKTDDGTMPIKASNVLTIFLGDNDDIHYLDGIAATDDKALSALKTTHSGFELRNIIFAAQRRVSSMRRNAGENAETFTVVIKPTAGSSYKNMVDAMDEMAITRTSRYALVDELTPAESKLLANRQNINRRIPTKTGHLK